MKYDYKCEACEYQEDFEFSMSEDKPKTIECPKCKKNMKRCWKSYGNIFIPEEMRAVNEHPIDKMYGKFPKGTRGKYH
jgi:hypothetical protein